VNTDDYTTAHWNAHNDPMNPAAWETLRQAARDIATDTSQPADLRSRMDLGARVARQCMVNAKYGINPLSDEAQDDIKRRFNL
jgi:hypothetical protein